MKLIFLSDTHNQLHKIVDKVPEGDVLVHCGDFGSSGSMQEYLSFLNTYEQFPHKHKLFTFGNHDGWAERQLNTAKDLAKQKNITCLVDEELIIDGVKFYGSPWTPRYGNWWWMKDRMSHALRHISSRIPDDVNVLFTHGPSWGIMDMSIYDKDHCGCEHLMRRIKELKYLKIHAFGHIHQWSGVETHDGIIRVNASICDEQYEPTNPPRVIDL